MNAAFRIMNLVIQHYQAQFVAAAAAATAGAKLDGNAEGAVPGKEHFQLDGEDEVDGGSRGSRGGGSMEGATTNWLFTVVDCKSLTLLAVPAVTDVATTHLVLARCSGLNRNLCSRG